MPERLRVIDPSRCWVRHVKRAPAGTTAPFRCSFDDPAELHRWRRGAQATDTAPAAAQTAVTRDGSVVFLATGSHDAIAPKQLADGTVDLTFAVAPAATTDEVGVLLKQTAPGVFLHALVSYSTGSAILRLYKRTGGAFTLLGASSSFTALAAGEHRLRVQVAGNVVTLTLYRVDTGTQLATVTVTLAGADATAYGTGIIGRAGFRVTAASAATGVALRALTAASSTDDLTAWDVGGGVFKAQPLEGVNGRQGWQSAEIAPALGDDGDFTIRFPNAVGDDGSLHRDRFALLTDATYRAGEEWLEFYREPYDVLFVGTPTRWKIDGGTLELSGIDAGALELGDRTGPLDPWSDPPQTVIEHYGRLTRAMLSSDFRAITSVASLPDGWAANVTRPGALAATGTVDVDPAGGGVRLQGVGGNLVANVGVPVDGVYADDYTVAWRGRHVAGQAVFYVDDPAGTSSVAYVTLNADGTGALVGLSNLDGAFKVAGFAAPALVDVRLVFLRRFVMLYVNGELLASGQRDYPWSTPRLVRAQVPAAGTFILESASVLTRQPILSRGASPGDYRTPGAPTPGGLHGYYFDLTPLAAKYAAAGATVAAAAFGPLDEAKSERLDATIDFDAAPNPPTWLPSGMPTSWVGVRWVGSIYLDLSGNGRRLRLSTVDDWARVWVGHRRAGIGWGDPVIDTTATFGLSSDVRSADLRTLLGPGAPSGWYPIVLEYVGGTAGNGLTLQESPLDVSGAPTAWATVPSSKLSPYGCVVDAYRLESNREVVKQLADTFGYQVTCEPRSLETGEFPGQLVPRLRAGRDTDYVIDSIEGTQASAEGDAGDALDRLIVDAAGIADPRGSGQLTAEVILPGSADAHIFLATGYESLSEISEERLLQQRASSLLALRGSPNEQVGVRPRGTRELVDTFPLTGALARIDWRPGDGVRLNLPEIAVVDLTPRQITKLNLPLYPDGVGAPSVGFRQRPRNVREIIRKALRTSLNAQRNYQGGLSTVQGSWAINSMAGLTASRLPLPESVEDVAELWLVVVSKSDTSAWTMAINGSSIGYAITAPGRYDLSNLIARHSTGSPVMTATVSVAGTGSIEWLLEALVRV